MRRFFKFIKDNILFVETLVLLSFIPLYPKLPLIGITNTWVYIRVEDFLVLLVLLSWLALLVRKKISLQTPLTLPIIVFWAIGAIATIHGVLLIFPLLANVFPNVAFLSLVRHIEYLSLFFIAFQGMRDKKFLKIVIVVLLATLVGIIFYGFGQRYLGFPAFLTSNEEFAKGIPITLSALSRVPSTFAGHYDLAGYLVLLIPIIVSLIFGIKNLFAKAALVILALFSFVLLFMTVSRISFAVVFVSLLIVFFFQKRKLVLLTIPLIIAAGILLIYLKPTVLQRFQSTVKTVDVLVDASTGNSIGHIEIVPKEFFRDKIVLQNYVKDQGELVNAMKANPSSPSAILPFKMIPNQAILVHAVNVSNGETLPQGTGYINLALSPVISNVDSFFYEFSPDVKASPSAQFIVLHGNFIVKRAAAYDLSFTTRFQGEWPRAIEAFQRNILVGSGYGSVSLAVDNNYLRILGETGILGFLSFFAIFLSFGIYVKKAWKEIPQGLEKSFIVGFIGGLVGLFLNATLIDIFESSKIAYTLWLLTGVSLGVVFLNLKSSVNLVEELKKVAMSSYAIVIFLLSLSVVLYSRIINNFFVGDDFTWLRWASQAPSNLLNYFISSDGFFYRPGTKIYFYFMHHFFWLNPAVYHIVSISLYFIISVLFFLLLRKLFKNTLISAFGAVLFLIVSGYSEAVVWISATGHLFNAVLGLLGLISFIKWDETKKGKYFIVSFISFALSLLFHELGVFLPLLVLAYKFKDNFSLVLATLKRKDFLLLFVPVLIYLALRFISNSHWFSGDYNYDLLKLPFNVVGNILGYIAVVIIGPASISFYEKLRIITRENIILTFFAIVIGALILFAVYKIVIKYLDEKEKQIIRFSLAFFVISLLPFLGLGDITSRYSLLAAIGVIPAIIILLKRIYEFLLQSGRGIAVGGMSVLIMVYLLFQVISLQQFQNDWAGAGTKVNNFFISFDSLYSSKWSAKNTAFHFVDVPIKWGEAWVFPVGLSDAVWFAVKNDSAKIYLDKDTETALSQVGDSSMYNIFVFNPDGSIKQYFKKNNSTQ